MSNNKDSNVRTIIVAFALCLVCSILVSAVAVGLKPQQQANQALDRNKNILMAADMLPEDSSSVNQVFGTFEVKLVNLETGKFATDDELKAVGITDVNSYDSNVASKDPNLSTALVNDPANIKRKPKFEKVYLLPDSDGSPKLLVLPIKGYGLWGTIYGFLTLDKDLNTIKGISFYSHKETPGLGALIEEPKWRSLWEGKQSYDEQGNIITGVVKNGTPKPNPNYVDGISGATLTGRGVNNFIQFWLGKDGYQPFIDNLRKGAV